MYEEQQTGDVAELDLDDIAGEAEADTDLIGEDPAELLGDDVPPEELEEF